ncbi:MAG: anion transporter [Desulfobacterales bacterium]|nr:anion transporter [Desulfobacterales bacterium]
MVTIIVFLIAYTGIALGRIPGLALDRTGIALIGAIAMVIIGRVPLGNVLPSIDFPTILLLYALMILSAQLRLGGFYTWCALKITFFMNRPAFFLFILMLVSAFLSALLANDIICFAFTPVLILALRKARLNPLPFLLGLAIASNIGSTATIIGNPQNMLIGQVGHLDFGSFMAWCAPPSILSLVCGFLIILWQYQNRFRENEPSSDLQQDMDWPPLNPWQSIKGIAAVVILTVLFFTGIPRELSAIAIAGALLCSRRMRTRSILGLLDWHLLTLFCGLFIIIAGLQATSIPADLMNSLSAKGFSMGDPLILTGISTVLSNMVSNVPAVMLLVQFLDITHPVQWYILSVSSTFAGNLIIIGSIANMIVIEQARQYDIVISFRQHAKTGLPVTILSLLILLGWQFFLN